MISLAPNNEGKEPVFWTKKRRIQPTVELKGSPEESPVGRIEGRNLY